MIESDGLFGDYGPFSFVNMMRGLMVVGTLGVMIAVWSSSPWFPWK